MAADVEITKGAIVHDGSHSLQPVVATNNTSKAIKTIKIEYGVFRKGPLLAARHVLPRQTAYIEVIANHAAKGGNARVGPIGPLKVTCFQPSAA